MKIVCWIVGFLTLSSLSRPTPVPEEDPSVWITVEGVAAGREAAPIAALSRIRDLVYGLKFGVIDGKYVSLGESVISTPLETRRKRLLGIEELKTGLFKARISFQVPAGAMNSRKKLSERLVRGEAELAGSLIFAREEARLDALEKGILEEVAERYPKSSHPSSLRGRIFVLGTLREAIEKGRYVILARLKVELAGP